MAPIKSSQTTHTRNYNMKNTIDSYFNKKNSNTTNNDNNNKIAATTTRFSRDNVPPVYCDLDGVLADHDSKMREIYGSNWRSLYFTNTNNNTGSSTSLYDNTEDFFNTLPWMKNGKELWEFIKVYNPTILTALPSSSTSSSSMMHEQQKRNWCRRELGDDVKVITTNGPWNKYKVSS